MAQVPSLDVIKQDAKRVFDCVSNGGVAICHYDLSYAILSATDEALRRVYAAKKRSLDRASGVVGGQAMHQNVHILSDEKRAMAESVTTKHGYSLSVIAPFAESDPFLGKLSPFMFQMATRDGTVNFLLNAGALREEIAALCWDNQVPFVASSANASLQGTKYRVQDIEPEVLSAADIVIDYGTSKWAHPQGLSSTQIDFRTMSVVRYGICYEEIAAVLLNEFGVRLPENPYKKVS